MHPPRRLIAAACGLALLAAPATAQEKKAAVDQDKVDKAVARGLEYLKKSQEADGSWSAQGGSYRTAMTGMAGLAVLMEGSTCRDGKYADNLSKAVEWFLKKSQPNGLLGTPMTEASRYTYGHGFGLLFLACVYGEEEDPTTRKKLEAVLKKAVEFSCKAVTSKGGWGYVSAKDGTDFDEGSTTVTQLQALRAARNAGIPVPKETIDNAIKYLKSCTTPRGGLVYNYTGPNPQGGERPPITAAAAACACSTGMYKDKHFGMWVKFCRDNIYKQFGSNGHDDYSNLYFGQVMYLLGDDRYQSLIEPDAKKENAMLWSEYKKMAFNNYIRGQGSDGSFGQGGGWGAGPIFATATALIIMQQEKQQVPFYHR